MSVMVLGDALATNRNSIPGNRRNLTAHPVFSLMQVLRSPEIGPIKTRQPWQIDQEQQLICNKVASAAFARWESACHNVRLLNRRQM